MNNSEKVKKSDRTTIRLLEAAIHAFSIRDFKDVSIAEIAREAELTPQGVYRYFSGKKELFYAALRHDVDALHAKVISEMKKQPIASLTGAVWYSYAAHAKEHPLARKLVPLRQHDVLDFVASLESTRQFRASMKHDLELGQKYGMLREDMNVELVMESTQYLLTHMLLPLIFEDKYMGDEWQKVTYLMLGIGFYPIPDLTAPEKQKAFEDKMTELIAKVLEGEQEPLG